MNEEADRRGTALDEYLAARTAQGFRIETRTRTQAVIYRRKPTLFFLGWLGNGGGRERHVVSVDQHGTVTSIAAQPVRW